MIVNTYERVHEWRQRRRGRKRRKREAENREERELRAATWVHFCLNRWKRANG